MNKGARILFVDDETNILDSMRRNLRKFNITTCNSPYDAIELIKRETRNNPFAVVVSDYKMPKMNGLEFLIKVKEYSPNTVRCMLTGYSDNDTAIRAINEGAIFRFLTKPISAAQLTGVLNLCIDQYRLIMAEKLLLRETLSGSLKVLTEVLSQSNQEAFGVGERIKRITKQLLHHIKYDDKWQVEIAAMLCQIGLTAIPSEIISKMHNNQDLKPYEQELYAEYPKIGARLIGHIPRLEMVAKIIEYQDNISDNSAPFGAKVINLAKRYDEMVQTGLEQAVIIKRLQGDDHLYGPGLLESLSRIGRATSSVALTINELEEGMIVDQDVYTQDSLLLISKGQEITTTGLMRLYNYKNSCGIKEPIMILRHPQEMLD